MPLYSQAPILLGAVLVSNPPVDPVDDNTGLPPRFWRANQIAIDFAVFDAAEVPVDLSNLTYLQLSLYESPTAPTPLVEKTVLAAAITPTINRADWLAGLARNARFLLSNAQTDLGLGGAAQKDFWLVVFGRTTGGANIVYVGGYVTVFNAAYALPAPSKGYVSREAIANGGGNSVVTPTAQIHTAAVTISGGASTRKLIVGAAGLEAGAKVFLRFTLPAVDAIIVQVYDQSLAGALLATINTSADGFLPNALLVLDFDGANLVNLARVQPADLEP